MKKISGYLFIFIASVLAFSLFGRLALFVDSILNLPRLFSDDTAYEKGWIVGDFFFRVAYVSLIIVLFRYGLRWIRSKRKQPDLNEVRDPEL